MAASTFVNLVRVYSNSAGTGPLVLGLAEPGFRGVEALTDGATYSYTFQIGVDNRTPGSAAYETGRGVWNASTSTLIRNVVESSLAGQPVGVLMNTPIAITVLAQDFAATDQAALAAAVLDAQDSADEAAASAADATAIVSSIIGDVALADAAATAAQGSATLAGTKADAASASATTASNAATSANNSAADASGSAIVAAASATNAAGSVAAVGASATAAANSATSAAGSASSAGTAATTASTAATTATTQAGIATTQAGIATTQAGNAATSATAAAGSASAAAGSATSASSSATSAGSSATTATGAATNATTASTNAAASATTASTAAASTTGAVASVAASANIATTAAITATTQAGIATAAVTSPSFAIQFNPATPTVPPSGVASGSTYWAVDSASTNLILYTNTAGTGVISSPLVKLSIFQYLTTYPGATEFALLDPSGFPWLAITPTTLRHQFIDALSSRTAALETFATHFPNISAPGAPEFSLTDTNGWPWLRATPTRLYHPTVDAMQLAIASNTRGNPDPAVADMSAFAEVIGINWSGESLALGHSSDPPISTTPVSYADMFGNAGLTAASIVPDDISDISSASDPNLVANRAAVTAAFETAKGPDADNWTWHGETPNSGCAQMIVQLLKEEDGIDAVGAGIRFLLVNDGRNGSAIQAEMDNDPALTYARVAASFSQAASIYGAAGKSWAPAASNLTIGTNDNYNDAANYPTPNAKYFYNLAVTLQSQRQSRMRALLGGTRRLPMLIGQTATHTRSDLNLARPHVALDQLQLALDHDEFMLPCIQYSVANNPNDVHLSRIGSKHMGAYHGWHLKRLLFDGIRMKPLVPVFRAFGSRIVATFPIARGHKIIGGVTASDTTVLSNWGVTAVTAGGTAKALTNPRVVGRNQVAWDAPSAPTDTWLFRCGWSGAVPGNSNKGFTNIAETRIDGSGTASPLIFDPGYLRLPMYRWLPICEVPLS